MNKSENKLQAIVKLFVEACLDKKADHVVSYDLEGSSWISDVVIVVGANNTIHCKALLESINETFHKLDEAQREELYPTLKVSGNPDSGWCIVDLNSILIHCVTSEIRDFYNLDTLFEKQGIAYHY